MQYDGRLFLKINIKALAAEARIIRHHEKRTKDPELRAALANHRRVKVRRTARFALLAYGFIRGRKYQEIEARVRKPLTHDNWHTVEKVARRFAPWPGQYWSPEIDERFKKWQTEALGVGKCD